MPQPNTIACLATMFFGAKLQGQCESLGYTYKGAIGPSGLIKQIQKHEPVAVLIDLSKEDVDIESLVHSIREATNAPIVAFCGHVATEQLQEAKTAGCDVVTTNGAITQSLEQVLRQVLH